MDSEIARLQHQSLMDYWQPLLRKPLDKVLCTFIALFFGLLSIACWAAEHNVSFITSQSYWIGDHPQTAQAADWKTYSGPLSLGYGSQPVWLKLSVSPVPGLSPEQPIEIDVRPGYLDQIDLYDPLTSPTSHKTVGDQFSWSNNARPSFNYNFAVPVGSAPRELLLRVKTNSNRLIDITALPPGEIIPWERAVLTQSNLIIFSLLFFFAWALYNGLIYRDFLFGGFAVLQLAALFYGVCLLGFVHVYLPDWLSTRTQEGLTSLSMISYSIVYIWFYKTLISSYPIKPWATYLLRILFAAIVPIIAIYFIGTPWISFLLNSYITLATCIALLLICFWGIAWKNQPENPYLLSRKVLTSYLLILLAANLLYLTPSNLNASSVLGVYGSTIIDALNGLLLTIILHVRSRNIAKHHQQRIAAEAMRLENEKKQRALQSEFMDMLAHELKTPLSIISLALDSQTPSEKLKNLATTAVISMKDVIARCIQATRLTDHNLNPSIQLIDLNRVVPHIINKRPESHRVTLHSPGPVFVLADKDLLVVAVNNLLDNAIKYGSNTVDIELIEPDTTDMAQIAIYNDVGSAGIPDPDRVFHKYYRSPKAHNHTGSGLGLYLSKALTELQQGTIDYQCINNRICFRLSLPTQR